MRPAFSLGEAAAPPPHATLAQAIAASVDGFENGRFLYVGTGGEPVEVSYRDTLAQARGLAAGLRDHGLRAGEPLLICLAEAKAIVPALWAAAIGGFVAVPRTQAARWGEGTGADQLAVLRRALGRPCAITNASAPPPPPEVPALAFDQLLATRTPWTEEPGPGAADAPRFAIPTSGTTGRPRLVGLSERAALARWWARLPDAAQATGFLSWSPFDHVMGLGLAMPNLPLKVHLDAARFVADPLAWLDALERSGATHATMTDFGMSLVVGALRAAPHRRWRLDHVRKIGIGAEAISGATCARFLDGLSGFGLRGDALILGYGLTECGPVAGGATPFAPGPAEAEDAPPELDRPTAGHAVRIMGETGYLVREGETGRIEVRGPTMTSGYLGDPEATAALFTPDGWLRTGDLGLLRDGKLTVTGREKEIVVVNARKYACRQIEAAIEARTDFARVLAAPLEGGGPDGPSGAPCAVFVVAERPDTLSVQAVAGRVRAATAQALRFAPRAVVLISPAEVPRTDLGKVRRLALPALLDDPRCAGRVDRLAPGAPVAAAGPASEAEARIAAIWRRLLRHEGAIDPDADFFALGGDSLLALRMSLQLEAEFGVPIDTHEIPTRLSIAALAALLAGKSPPAAPADPAPEVVAPSANPLPRWCVERLRALLEPWPGTPAAPGGFIRRVGAASTDLALFWCTQTGDAARNFETSLGARHTAYVMRSSAHLFRYETPLLAALVDLYAAEIARIRPRGPLVLGGNCQGAIVALALTRQLVAAGREVRLFVAADSRFAEICGTEAVPVPVALFPATLSKFNPRRHFRDPEIGLRKLAPQGLRMESIEAGYAKLMFGTRMQDLAAKLEAAIDWASGPGRRPDPPPPPPSPASLYQRRIEAPVTELDLAPGQRLRLAVKVGNLGPLTWEPFPRSGVALGNHWLSPEGEIRVWSDARAPLDRAVEAGGWADMTLDIRAPREPGAWVLEVDLVEEGIRWFGDLSSAPLHIPVRVRPRYARALSRLRRLAGGRP